MEQLKLIDKLEKKVDKIDDKSSKILLAVSKVEVELVNIQKSIEKFSEINLDVIYMKSDLNNTKQLVKEISFDVESVTAMSNESIETKTAIISNDIDIIYSRMSKLQSIAIGMAVYVGGYAIVHLSQYL